MSFDGEVAHQLPFGFWRHVSPHCELCRFGWTFIAGMHHACIWCAGLVLTGLLQKRKHIVVLLCLSRLGARGLTHVTAVQPSALARMAAKLVRISAAAGWITGQL